MHNKSILKIILFFLALSCLFNTALAESYYKYQDAATSLWGIKNSKNNIILPAQYEQIAMSDDGDMLLLDDRSREGNKLIPVVKFGSYWRVDIEGKHKFQSVFFDNGHDYYEEGLARFIVDNKVGFHNQAAKIVIEPIYDFAQPFRDGYSCVCNECWSAYLGEITFHPLSSKPTSPPREDLYKEVIGGKWGVIDKNGNVVVPLQYNSWNEADQVLTRLKANN